MKETALLRCIATEMRWKRWMGFKWFLCNDVDVSADVFNGVNSMLVPRTCCLNGCWHEDLLRREVRIGYACIGLLGSL